MCRILLVSCLCWLSTAGVSAQLFFKIEALPDGESWGVFVKPCSDLTPSFNTITGSGQVTLVFQKGLTVSGFTSQSGTWIVDAAINGPVEAPDKTYVSIGFITDNPKIVFHSELETQLFSFKLNGAGTKTPALLENGKDPFNQLPNSMNTNPGNELSVIDFGVSPTGFYNFSGIYTAGLVACASNPPQDSTGTNPNDTTGMVNDTTIVTPHDSTGTTTNIFELKKSETVFKLSPNPALDWVSLTFNDDAPQNGLVRLWNSNGMVLGAMDRGRNSVLKLNVEALPSGLYFVSYEMDGKLVQRERLVKY